MELYVRPAGKGKHNAIPFFANEEHIRYLDQLPKVYLTFNLLMLNTVQAGKVEQQKRRRILDKLSKAILSFAETNSVPSCLRECLEKTNWAAVLLEQLDLVMKK